MRLFEGSLVTYASAVGTAGLSALTGIVIARALGPQGRGDVAVLLLTPMLIVRVGGLSLGKASIYLVGQEKVPFSSAFWASLLGSLMLGSILTLLGLIAYKLPAVESIFRGISSREVVCVLCLTPLLLYYGYLIDLQRAGNHLGMFNLMRFQWFTVNFLMVVALAVFFRLSTVGAVLAWGMGLLVSVIVGFVFLLLAEKPFVGFDVASVVTSLGAMAAYGWQIHVRELVNFLSYRFDVFLVKGLLDSTAVGYYAVATNVAEMLWFLPDSVATVLLPRVSQIRAQRAARLTPLAARTVLVVMAGMGFMLFVFATPVVTSLYSGEFLPAVVLLRILIVGVVAFSLYKVLSADLTGRGKAMVATIPVAVSLILAIGLNLVLIPRWGVQGTAWAATISYLVATLIAVVVYIRTSGVSISRLLTWNGDDLQVYRRSLTGLSRYLSMGDHW